MSEPIRWIIPAILFVASAGALVLVWWERRHPSSYPGSAEHEAALESVRNGAAPNLTLWQSLSTEEQAAFDAEAIARAEEAARLAIERASDTNSLFRP
jgi:hypothetical protein